MAGLVLVTPPTEEPLTVADLKAQSRITGVDEDVLVEQYISEARQAYEKQYSRALLTQVWDWALDTFPWDRTMAVPLSPLQSVTSITYTDPQGNAATMPATDYEVDAVAARIALAPNASWPGATLRAVNGVMIRFTAGYATVQALLDAEADAVRTVAEWAAKLYGDREQGLTTSRSYYAPYA